MPSLSQSDRFNIYTGPAESALNQIAVDEIPLRVREFRKLGESILSVSATSTVLDLLGQLRSPAGKTHGTSFQVERGFKALSDYIASVIVALSTLSLSGKALVHVGDATFPIDFPTLAKARQTLRPSLRVLAPLQYTRHFGPLTRQMDLDREWEKKKPVLSWRGATTGPEPGLPVRKGQSRAWICNLAVATQDHPRIDVGYSQVTGNAWSAKFNAARWRAPAMTIDQQLENRFLLALEGNDVASGLKWMMGSQSCVLMPEPSIESWFCETALIPYEHYVPVKSDLSDVEEMLSWCLDNDSQAKDIAQNGREFATSFMDLDRELELFHEVLTWYVSHPKIEEYVSAISDAVAREERSPR